MILQKGFLLASLFYLLNNLSCVAYSVAVKYFQTKLNIELYELMIVKSIIEALIVFPFCIKYIKHFTKNLHIVVMLSVLYAVDILLYNSGYKLISVNTGTLILFLNPLLWMILLSRIILKEKKFNIVNAIFLIICLFSVLFTIAGDLSFGGFNKGYIFLLLDSIIVPLGMILQKKFSDNRPIIYALFTNSVALFVISFFMSDFTIPKIDFELIKSCFIIGLLDLSIYSFAYIAFKMTDVAILQPLQFTRIFFSIVLSYLILQEVATKQQIISAIIIIIVNIISIFYSKRKHFK